MARRWRIRHKLMLGLAAAVAILAMLLAGTLNGLWSYYVTMKGIGSKLRELDEAEQLKPDVAALNLPERPDNPVGAFRTLAERIPRARASLERFDEAFQETLRRDVTDDDGEHVGGIIAALRVKLDRLGEALKPSEKLFSGGVTLGGSVDDVYAKERERIQLLVKDLERTSDDLRASVRGDLHARNGLSGLIARSRRHYQVTLAVLIGASALGLVLMLTALRFFYTWIADPVRDLQEGVSRVAEGDFDHRIRVESGDEMEELAASFNDMTGRLNELYKDMARQINERSRQLVRSERLASAGFLAAGVAHEINNPLASIAFCAEALEARLAEMQEPPRMPVPARGRKDLEIFGKYLKMIQEEAFRCKSITERLLDSCRGGERKREQADLTQLVQSVLDVAQHLKNSRGKEIVFSPPGPVLADVSAEEIKSVVLNLVVNALDSMEEGGRLTIDLRARDGAAEVVFADTGCGMTADVLENIFEPFFTRNRSGKGTGLGLTITHRIISQHGGEIEASSPGADRGSTFRVRLPLDSSDQESAVRSQEARAA